MKTRGQKLEEERKKKIWNKMHIFVPSFLKICLHLLTFSNQILMF